MQPKSQEFKTAMSAVREQIATIKRQGSRRGFADYQGCRFICHHFINILKDADKAAERAEYAFAYSVAALILINLAKLASAADDSAGGITDAQGYVKDILEKACAGVEYGTAEAEYIYLQSIKDSQNKAFEGWDEFVYDLLLKTARLATKNNKQKILTAADELYGRVSDSAYSSWADPLNVLVRLEVIKATGSDVEATDYINANLKYDAIRRIAVTDAINTEDYARAEKLCFDALDSNEEVNKYPPSEWRYLLFKIYDKSGDTENKIQAAYDLLFRFDTKYFSVLKQLLTQKGVWEVEYPTILERLEQSFPYHKFMEILSNEGELSRLLEQVRKYPSSVFDYGKQLAELFASQTYTICLDVIYKDAGEADNRIKYRNVCSHIKKLFDFGGTAEAETAISELKTKFPRRPAMLEELDKTMIWVEKKCK